uniref:Uncharacterized protein n=1 Tax=Orbilia brochopaga TaxID=3140254 RepID=A0A481ZN53_9PEZI|nr:hypothetical protein [Drechslerella brochopaga]QBL02536.1 hypothetical protein [Drechslerella brochopaga]
MIKEIITFIIDVVNAIIFISICSFKKNFWNAAVDRQITPDKGTKSKSKVKIEIKKNYRIYESTGIILQFIVTHIQKNKLVNYMKGALFQLNTMNLLSFSLNLKITN